MDAESKRILNKLIESLNSIKEATADRNNLQSKALETVIQLIRREQMDTESKLTLNELIEQLNTLKEAIIEEDNHRLKALGTLIQLIADEQRKGQQTMTQMLDKVDELKSRAEYELQLAQIEEEQYLELPMLNDAMDDYI